jgi:hypothetical protein
MRRRALQSLLAVLLLAAAGVSRAEPRRSAVAGAPPGTERVFGHICEEPHLQEIARAHAVTAAPPPAHGKRRKPAAPAAPRTLCAAGDFGFSRASIYLQLEPGQQVWLFDAADASGLGGAAPDVALELGKGNLFTIRCAGCDGRSTAMQPSEDGVLGALWLEVAGGRLHVREHGTRRALGPAGGIPVRGRLFLATPAAEAACGECDLMALAIYLPPDDARVWRRIVGRPTAGR